MVLAAAVWRALVVLVVLVVPWLRVSSVILGGCLEERGGEESLIRARLAQGLARPVGLYLPVPETSIRQGSRWMPDVEQQQQGEAGQRLDEAKVSEASLEADKAG